MKKKSIVFVLTIATVIAIFGFTITNYNHANGSEVAMTNSPHDGSGDCTGCHSGGSAAAVATLTATPAFTNNTYVPGTVYTLAYKVTGYSKFGFDIELNNGNISTSMGAGTNVALTNCKVTANPYSQGYPANVSQTAAVSSSSSATWHWTAPTSGTVYVNSVGLGVNNNGSTSGDKMVQYNLVLTPATSGTPPVANFSAANTTICAGQSIAFTDLSTNTPTSWSWSFTGGTPSTSTSQNPTVAYNTAGTYAVALTATNGFGSNTKTQTGYITVKAIPATPSASSNSPVCLGSTINLTTAAVAGATYNWTGPSTFTSSSQNPTRSNSTTAMAGTYSLTTTVNGCTSAAGTTAVVVNGSTVTPAVSISITTGGNPTCTGQSLTFTASPTNGGTTPSYQWKLNGTNVGTNSPTYTNASLANGNIITCLMTSNNSCASPTTATSNAITMITSGSVTPSVTIAVTSGSNPSCTGQSVTFTASPTNGGATPSYQWKLNGTSVGTNSSTYNNASLATGNSITCIMTSSLGCASPTTATSNAITMTIGSSVTASVAIAVSSGSNPTCTGQSITFTATPTNGGTTPTYQWKLNGVNTGTNSPNYISTAPNNSDLITCVMTSSSGCANPATVTSNGITVIVTTSVVPTLSTAITSGSNPTCSGQPVTFSANPTNSGTTPSYQWKLNGTNVGSDSASYTSNYLANGDIISCVMTAASSCGSGTTTATASNTTMTVDSLSPAAINITGVSTICAGSPLMLRANPINGGPTPSFQWKLNGNFWGLGDSTLINTSPVNGDIITCIMTSSSSCANPSVGISNLVTVTVNNGPPTIPTITQNDITLTSSSATGNQWFLNGTEVPGATGQNYVAVANGSYQVVVSNGCALASSDATSVTTVGINELSDENLLLIYPNPNNGNFAVSFSSTERTTYTLQITSVLGQVVFKEELKDFTGTYSKQLNVADYGKGIYAISLLNSKKGILKKIIVY
jgi:hypothetical protein